MTGKRVLLVVDAGFGDLEASAASASRVARCLEANFDFTETVRFDGPRATVADIRGWLTGEARSLGEGDALAVHWVGHGEIVRDPTYVKKPIAEQPDVAELSLLVTADIHRAGHDEVGIAGLDLMAWLAPIAAATGNVTVVLDACHATGMLPGHTDDAAARAAVEAAMTRVKQRVRRSYQTCRSSGPASRVVRLVATTQNEGAEEGLVDGRKIGLFSEALAASLEQADAASLTWDDHILRIQRQVLGASATQRPGVEGPRHRLPFSTEHRDPADSHPCNLERGRTVRLEAGVAHGVEHGDEFELVLAAPPSRRIGTAAVHAVGVACSSLQAALGLERTGEALRAVPLQRARPLVVAIRASRPDPARMVRGAIPDRIGVTVEGPDPHDAILELGDAGTELRLADGEPVHVDGPLDDAAALRRLVDALARVAHWHRVERGLRVLASCAGAPLVDVSWRRGDRPLAPGETLTPADEIGVRVASRAEPELFVSVFHVRGDRRIVHWTEDLDHGQTCLRSRVLDTSQTAAGADRAWSLRRDPGLWDRRPVQESIVVFASKVPVSLHGVATPSPVVYRSAEPAPAKPALMGPPPAVLRLDFRFDASFG